VDEIKTSGLTPAQLDELLTEKYAQELRKPVVTVIVRSFTTAAGMGRRRGKQDRVCQSHGRYDAASGGT